MARTLSTSAARRLYDRIGRFEDSQAFYEDPALDILVAEGGFETAGRVLEFGCGTGRLAERLLDGPLPGTAHYSACDISGRMIALSRERLARFGNRVTLWQSEGAPDCVPGAPPFDRIVTSYVLDLLSEAAIHAFLDNAHAALVPGGRLCAASITHGGHGLPRVVSGIWSGLHRLAPVLTGGCRPIRLSAALPSERWRLVHHAYRTAWAVTSEVVIAEPVRDA